MAWPAAWRRTPPAAQPVIDAICPLVAKTRAHGRRYAGQGREVVLVGHAGHAEVEGMLGQIDGLVHLVQTIEDVALLAPRATDRLAYVTQTTLSVDDTRHIIAALKACFPAITGPDMRDICYATQNRQQVVRDLAGVVDLILVVGSANSSNSDRPREFGESLSDRRGGRVTAGVVRSCRDRRPDGRCLGPRISGGGGDRRPARAGRYRGHHP
jgi:4-hydroxy-3-methylbut-2-enyl diphosphate reductase